MYGGQCHGMFTRSISDLSSLCTRHQIPLQYYFLFNESLITRARNYCADEFMRSDATHLMFIDSDIGFDPQDVLALLALSTQNDDYDILCAPYPKKCISWEKIVAAVNKGVADEDPRVLENFVGDFVFNSKRGTKQIKLSEPAEVMEGGTGFMLIKKNTFQKMNERFPQLLYRPDHARTEHFDGTREIMAYFDALIDDKYTNVVNEVSTFYDKNPNATKDQVIEFLSDKRTGLTSSYSNRYLSEDYMFCYNAQKIGLKVWLCPWMKLKHAGSYVFGGSLADLASVGANPTVDPELIKKNRRK